MQHAFFSLVRSGLWGTPADRQLFRSVSPDDWETVYRMANSQALLALTFDGISSLPAELRPPRALYLKWAARTAQIEQANKRLNQLLPELNTLYREAGLHPVLLKGQGIGTNYRTPLHRQCGDIDIYLGKQGQPIANRLLLQQGAIVEGEASDKHASYSLKREPPHHPPAEQSACQPALSADYQKMVSAGNRLCPILRNRERGLEGRQYRHTSGHLQCTLYLPTCLCTFPEQRNRPAPAMRLDLSACQSPQRNRCHHPASPVAGPRTIACRTSIRLHCRHPTGIARQPASFPLGRHQADRRTIIGRHPVYR